TVTVQTGGGTSNGVNFTVIQQPQPQPSPAPQTTPQTTPQPAGGGTSNGYVYPRRRRVSGYLTPSSPSGLTNTPATFPQPAPAPTPTGGGTGLGSTGTGAGAGSGISLGSSDGVPAATVLTPAAVRSGGTFTIQGSNFGATQGWVR